MSEERKCILTMGQRTFIRLWSMYSSNGRLAGARYRAFCAAWMDCDLLHLYIIRKNRSGWELTRYGRGLWDRHPEYREDRLESVSYPFVGSPWLENILNQ